MPQYDVVLQEIVDFRCGAGGKRLCFSEPSEIASDNKKQFIPVSGYRKRNTKIHSNSIKWLAWGREWIKIHSR